MLPPLALENLRFRDQYECARGDCRIEGRAPAEPAEPAREDGASTVPPLLGWIHVVRPGATLHYPRIAEVDLLGVVLAGRASLRPEEAPPGASVRAQAWTAFLLPEGGASLRAEGSAPVAFVLVAAGAPSGAVVAASAPRPRGGFVLRPFDAVEDLAWAGGAFHARIALEAPASPRASLQLLLASEDAPVAEHAHPGAWELLVAVSAAGRLHIPSQPAPADPATTVAAHERTVTAGAIAYVPASVRHAWSPDGTHPLIAIQAYAPPGAEQRFRTLAGAPRAHPEPSPR